MDQDINMPQEQNYTFIKELLLGRERITKFQLNGFQNSILNFCKNMNNFQIKDNFFNLTIKEQFDFNECIEHVSGGIKKDFIDMEGFYLNCKNSCLNKYKFRAEEIEAKINEYNESMIGLFKPTLNPCIEDCISMYHYTVDKYYNYMIKDLGIYSEFIDFKKNII